MLDKLSKVQARDLELDVLAKERQETPEELVEATNKQASLEQHLETVQAKFDDIRRRADANQLELDSLEERRKAAADAALMAESSKEASQYQNQEIQLANRYQELEQDTFPLLSVQEDLDGQLGTLKTEIDELKPVLADLNKAEEARVKAVDEKVAVVHGDRDAIAREIDKPLLKQYELVRKSKRGMGLANVTNNNCGGCSMRLPIHIVQKVLRNKDIVRCPSCGRILWFKQEISA